MSDIFVPLLTSVLSATGANGDARVLGRAEVIDGDTLEIGVVRIRLNGIDAPEAGQTCLRASGQSWQCGTAATHRLAELVEGKEIECRARDRDVCGRIIADCWQDRTYVNQRLIADGLAWAFVRYSDAFLKEEARARSAGRGFGPEKQSRLGSTAPTDGNAQPRCRPGQVVRSRVISRAPARRSTIRRGRLGMGARRSTRVQAGDGFAMRRRPRPRAGGQHVGVDYSRANCCRHIGAVPPLPSALGESRLPSLACSRTSINSLRQTVNC